MDAQRAEFALGELASHEIASALGDDIESSSFLIKGASTFVAEGAASAGTTVKIVGSSTAAFGASLVQEAGVDINASSGFSAAAHADLNVEFLVEAGSSAQWASSEVARPEFHLTGSSTARFDIALLSGFDIVGRAATMFPSQADAQVEFALMGSSWAEFIGVLYNQSGFYGLGGSSAQFDITTYAQVDTLIQGVSTTSFRGSVVRGAAFETEGKSATNFRAIAAMRTMLTAAGTSAFTLDASGIRRRRTQFFVAGRGSAMFAGASRRTEPRTVRFAGSSSFIAAGGAEVQSEFRAEGHSTAQFERGRQVLPYLDPAEYRTERLAEQRGVERPEENRTAEYRT